MISVLNVAVPHLPGLAIQAVFPRRPILDCIVNSNPPRVGVSDEIALCYNSFRHGTVLFFLLAIASCCRTEKNSRYLPFSTYR